MKLLHYIKDRLDERSTWLLIGTGVTGAAALEWPWSLIVALIGTVAALIPDKADAA